MTDTRNPDPVDSPPDDAPDANPDSPPSRDDERSDIEQTVAARSDAVARFERHRGEEPATFTESGIADGVGGTGGEVKNQNDDAQ